MKLLSDFDGVWTYPDEEGAAHGAELDARLTSLVPEARRPETAAWLAAARAAVRAAPERWGWLSAGRLSAFADEDPFTEHGALLHYLHEHRGRDAVATRLVAGVEASGRTLEAFGGECHVAGVRSVEARRGPGITAAAAAAGQRLLASGVEIVVVSNSDKDKLNRWFGHAQLPHTLHPERAERALRLRGSARKFVLAGGSARAIEVGPLAVDTARPLYERVLTEEHPDAVVGDAFSLDLSLPLWMKRTDPSWRNVRLFWLVHPYAPQRLRAAVAGLPAGEVEAIEGGLATVADRLLG